MKSALEKALAAFKKKRYAEAIQILEPMVVTYRDSFRFYYLLGLSCLYSGDSGGAATYLRRAEQLKEGDKDVQLALAALQLRRRDVKGAIESYLAVLEEHPGDARAKRALEFLRKNADESRVAELVDTGRIERLYPRLEFRMPWATLIAIAVSALFLLAMGALAVEYFKDMPSPRPEVDLIGIELGKGQSPVSENQTARIILTEKQVTAGFERAKKYFGEYRDNAGLKEVNALLQSNASDYVKSRARQLAALAVEPSFQSVRDYPDFEQMMKDPSLYEGCYVKWKGRAANYVSDKQGCSFDFLVGYQDKAMLRGIIPVRFSQPMGLDPEHSFELLAKIRVIPSGPVLEGVAIHDLAYGGKE
jgi:tetratricopeptide (TPR) repeat protein